MVKVLLIQDSMSDHVLIRSFLPRCCVVFHSPVVEEALPLLRKSVFDAVIAGPSVNEKYYEHLIKTLQSCVLRPELIVLSRTAEGGSGLGKLEESGGLFLFLPDDIKKFEAKMSSVVSEKLRLMTSRENLHIRERMSILVGESEKMIQVKSNILKYSTAPGPVLIYGESGTGKEIAAKLLHDFSGRSDKIYHALNAGSIPAGLCETELFGAEDGAYTGAVKRPGCFEYADGGTLFLDEIGELGLGVQAELLRVLENGQVKRIGGNRHIKTDIRLISATNRNLLEAAGAREFRKDLLFRINMFQITIPPLRERKEDIPELLICFSDKLRADRPDKYYEFSDSFINRLYDHNWPGNVRELRNVFHRAVYSSDSEVLTADTLQFD
jgi:transcriptional regulator with PAS, ATPase and Fis domain